MMGVKNRNKNKRNKNKKRNKMHKNHNKGNTVNTTAVPVLRPKGQAAAVKIPAEKAPTVAEAVKPETKETKVEPVLPALKDDKGQPITKEVKKEEKIESKPVSQSTVTMTEAQKLDAQIEMFKCLSSVQFGRLKEEECTALNNYFIQGEMMHLVHKNRIGLFGVKVSDTGLQGCPTTISAPAFVKLYVPKIPEKIYRQIIGFFREVMKEHSNSEAFAQVYWDSVENEYVVHIPEQKVSGARVAYDSSTNLDRVDSERYIFVFECHSHNSMQAFFSGVDDADEKETRIYGVFGELDQDKHAEKFRIVVAGKYISISAGQIFDLKQPEEADFPQEWLDNISSGWEPSTGMTYRGGHGHTELPHGVGTKPAGFRSHSWNQQGGGAGHHRFPGQQQEFGYGNGYYDREEEYYHRSHNGYMDEDYDVEADPSGYMMEIEELTEQILDKTDGFQDMHGTYAFTNMLEQYGVSHTVVEAIQNGGNPRGV